MRYVGLARRCAVGILLCWCLSGCFPASDSQTDEKREPYFINGKSLVGQMDYQGAIDSFEKALEVNPRSASAHFELGWLYEDKANDPAAAIYHYERYLKFSAHPDQADVVHQHINSCKLELAKTVSAVGPLASPAQRELERVLIENKQLRDNVTTLQSQLEQMKGTPVARVPEPAYVTPLPQTQVERNPAPSRPVVMTPHNTEHIGPSSSTHPIPKTYSIKSGDNPAALARRFGVSLNSLMAANPQVNPKHLHVGQILNIPAP
ncbi:MAG TPA: LysM peptidoglycan-binding domain-containing protein [Verrucomicrobiae bacterium]|nr:LysM peptidoglycan-binding domain-containing protein [Verrucomicrobiae bacterium]HEX4264186.1 LysM peptidoglycan-binding domain-containing protein [Verrucomicrobiae bacterium]